jgi:hypothetical protein
VAEFSRAEDSEPPARLAQVPPPDIAAGTGQLRLIVQELKDDIKEIKSHRHSDFVFHLSVLAGGFILLATMLIVGYFKLDERIIKSDDKINTLANNLTRIETKLGDLLERIPPVQTPVSPKR